MTQEPTALDVVKAVLDPLRLAVLGSAASGPVSVAEVSDRLGVEPREVAEAIGNLRAVGLLDDAASLDVDALRGVAKDLPREHEDLGLPVEGPWTPDEAAVLGRFFDGARLVQIPQTASKRRLVLEKLALAFEPGRRYPERDVNFMIQLVHPDYAAIRRYMVEEGFLDRADGAYWRTGGRYDVTPAASDGAWSGSREIPTEMEGVRLRPYDRGMAEALVRAANDQRIPAYMSDRFPHPYTPEAAEDWIDFATGMEPPDNWAVFVDGVLAGGVGGSPMQGERTGTCEIGWWLNPAYWGRGIMTACARALIDEFFGRGMMRLWAPIMAPNAASAAVAAKAGMHLEGVGASEYLKAGVRHDALSYALTRREWLEAAASRTTPS
jgi:RimJ/RimL family protein N-acetyltransferase